MPEVFEQAAAILACWFPGTGAGTAVARLLTGEASPTAGLAVTWPRHPGQIPIAYSARPGGRPEAPGNKYTSKYLDLPNTPQFPFGHGLGYTGFTLAVPTVQPSPTGGVAVTTRITNTGDRIGSARLLAFIRDPVASISRPTLALRAFARIPIDPGETFPFTFLLDRDAFAFPGPDLRPVVEPGTYEVHVGFSADRAGLRSARFTLE
jgi:beta-glucosidase